MIKSIPMPVRFGEVVEADTQRTISRAKISASWKCVNFPPSHKPSDQSHSFMTVSDNAGGFKLERPAGQRGLILTQFTLHITANKFIDRIFRWTQRTKIEEMPDLGDFLSVIPWDSNDPFMEAADYKTLPDFLKVEMKPDLGICLQYVDAEGPYRDQAAKRLSRTYSIPATAIPDLVRAIESSDQSVKDNTLQILTRMKSNAWNVIPAIAALLAADDPLTAITAAKALGVIGGQKSLAALREAEKTRDDIRPYISKAIEELQKAEAAQLSSRRTIIPPKPTEFDNWDGPDIFIQRGHMDSVNSAVFTPDEKYVVTGSGGLPALILWDAASGMEIHRFGGHPRDVKSVAVTPDGRHVLTGGQTMNLWELFPGKHKLGFTGHNGFINAVALSPDGRYAVSGGKDKTVRLWDVSTGKTIHVFRGHTDVVSSVIFTHDGRHILSGSWDATMRLWDLSGDLVRLYKRHDSRNYYRVNHVALSPDGKRIAGELDAKMWI